MTGPNTATTAGAQMATADALRRFATDVFVRVGMPPAPAGTVADVLVWANLRGMDSHGVTRIPRYAELMAVGDVNPNPVMTARLDTPAAVVLEADRAAGPVAMTEAMARAVSKAREVAVGLALVRGTTHTAALGYYTLRAVQDGMVGIAVSASGPNMVYHGARAAGVSTNPISIAVPGGDRGPLLLDMATSVVSLGSLVQARKTGQAIPAGAAVDGNGNPTTDPQAARIPLPLGGPKGSGLSLMIECLTSLVVANPILAEVLEETARGRQHRQNALVLAIDLARFGDPAMFRREVARLIAALKALPRQPEVDEILMPGERGRRTLERRSREGIPIPRAIVDELHALADRLGVTMFPVSPRP
ncbi:MAG: Ldh family oxidoreductase [Candidatus Rokuibacteriota bacterium]